MATAHFSDAELACKCGCGTLPSREHQDLMEAFRVRWGKPMHLSSCARCATHNRVASTTGPRGPHVPCEPSHGASDVLVYGAEAYRMLAAAIDFGWRGIGIHQRGPVEKRFLHFDNVHDAEHPRPWIWTY